MKSPIMGGNFNKIHSVAFCVITNLLTMYFFFSTELEVLRTQTEFDDSLTLKIYLFQFVNYYASIFYVAFFKRKFIGRPGSHIRYFGYRQEDVNSALFK